MGDTPQRLEAVSRGIAGEEAELGGLVAVGVAFGDELGGDGRVVEGGDEHEAHRLAAVVLQPLGLAGEQLDER